MGKPADLLLGIDIGTTHCKAGLFDEAGEAIGIASRPTRAHRNPVGHAYYDPQEMWETIAGAVREVLAARGAEAGAGWGRIVAVGIASMAETGLLVDRKTGSPRSTMIPWFDKTATTQARQLEDRPDLRQRFRKAGIYPNFKSGLVKLLRLFEQDPGLLAGAVWLSAADYAAFRLTGEFATDYSLAGRTYAFDLDRKTWDENLLLDLGLDAGIFPQPVRSGTVVGPCSDEGASSTGLARGTPIAIAGHDHVCGAFAAGAVAPGVVFDSMGTAEPLVGAIDDKPLDEAQYRSGLVYGCHVARQRRYWMGGLSASGGSLEWARALLGEPPLSYSKVEALLEKAPPGPSGILYFPYLSGSGSPHTDLSVRGALIGLDAEHGRPHLLKAVLEGTAYELEVVRRVASRATGAPVDAIFAAGGGTRSRHWMQIKADVFGCRLEAMRMPETTLLGAALAAGVGCGFYKSEAEALLVGKNQKTETYLPDPDRSQAYRELFERGYLMMQAPLRKMTKNSP